MIFEVTSDSDLHCSGGGEGGSGGKGGMDFCCLGVNSHYQRGR